MSTVTPEHLNNLESLVIARTEQLREYLKAHANLKLGMKAILTAENLEQAKQAAQVALDRDASILPGS